MGRGKNNERKYCYGLYAKRINRAMTITIMVIPTPSDTTLDGITTLKCME